MKRLKPTVTRKLAAGVDGVWGFGVESWRQDIEVQFVWGTQTAGRERYLVVHLGRIELMWRWMA